MIAQRRKRLNRKQRLQAAKKWIPTYNGRNLVRGYRRWFGVDFICAMTELEMLGYEIDPKYKEQILKQEEAKRKQRKEEGRFKDKVPWQDDNFYFIAGYTSGGAPYGITWEEYEKEYKEADEESSVEEDDNDIDFFDGDIPF